MVDDSEGKAIGSDDCHMTPIRDAVTATITDAQLHRLQALAEGEQLFSV
jgi:hypothetical protein